jgi:hypothetical protein
MLSLNIVGVMTLKEESRSTHRKPCHGATFSTTNPALTSPGSSPGLRCGTLVNKRLTHDTVPLVGAEGSWSCLHQPSNKSQMNPVCNLTYCLLNTNFVRSSHYHNAVYVPRTSNLQTMCKEQWSFDFPPVNATVLGLHSVLSYSAVCSDVLTPCSSLNARDQILHPHKTTSRGL